MTVWDIPGQSHVTDVLRGAVVRGEAGHAWAFLGPREIGQQEAARALAAALNCRSPVDDQPCGECDDCVRCLRGGHPAYWEFTPTGAFHRVEEVRDRWLPAAFHTAAAGAWKVLRIVEAERMNEAAANAFLKGLEEPPPRTTWVLEVTDPEELPDTILSRCRGLRFSPCGRAHLDAEASDLGLDDADERSLAVRASLGSPVTLRRLAAPGGLDDLRAHCDIPRRLRLDGPAYALEAAKMISEETKRWVAALKQEAQGRLAELEETYGSAPPSAAVRELSDDLSRREREARTVVAQGALDDLVGWYRDCLAVTAGAPPGALIHADAEDRLREDALALGPAAILHAVDRVLAVRDDLVEFNLQLALALEALLLELSALTLAPVSDSAS